MNARDKEKIKALLKVREKEGRRVAAALRAAGLQVDSIYDLVNTRSSYTEAIPLLISLLPGVKESVIKEGVVRALAVKQARPLALAPLIAEYRAIPPDDQKLLNLKWAIGNTLDVIADDSVFEEIAALAQDRRHGQAREMVALALGRMKKSPRAVDVLIGLLDDDEVVGHAAMALGRLKARKAEPALERLRNHEKAWIRKEVERALAKIQKAKLKD
jgi:HEAT repeat protein